MIAALAKAGGILPARDFAPDQIQPASLDLRLGDTAYRVRASFLPRHTTVAERIEHLKLHEIALGDGAVLETGCVYIVPLLESLALPRRHRGRGQSEKLDRPARRVHARHHRSRARLRPHRARLSRPALCGDFAEDVSGAGARRHAAVAASPAPRPCGAQRATSSRALHARERLVNSDGRGFRGRHFGERRSRGLRARTRSSAIAPSATPA